jgi:outer membrane protein OmpA-like peptidoglycan-associated protein
MENVPVRNYLNPAFQPLSDFYFGLPVLGYTQFGIENNSVALKDIIYKQNNQTIFFFDPAGNKQLFYNLLKPTTFFQANASVNLLDFGFRTGNAYWTFSLTQKLDGNIGIPKDLLKFPLFGTPELYNNTFNFTNLDANLSVYTEATLGYSLKLNEKLSVGGKLKFLYGTANISTKNQNLSLNTGVDKWVVSGSGTLNASLPGVLKVGNQIDSLSYTSPSATDLIKSNGMGAGFDLGVSFKPIDNLTVSASLTDFGFITWNRNVNNINYSIDYTYSGVGPLNILSSTFNLNSIPDSIINGLNKSVSLSNTEKAYTTFTSPKLNIGVEYSFFKNKLSVGLLSRTISQQNTIFEEITGSVNGRPTNWFNMSLSYSVMNGRTSNIGAGLGIRTGFINWTLAADYIPLYYVSASNMIPYNTKGMNVALGINLVFNSHKDSDHDGVVDKLDKCPETPKGVKVDKNGCPIDSDGDGVPDYLDKCPNTPKGTKVDKKGCPLPLDSDGDGIADDLDKCPNTPKGVKVDKNGCPIDSDGDGIPDYMDKCSNTPASVKVDSVGCPIDTDHDGVPDYLDKCADTPKGVKIDKNGCPDNNIAVKQEPKTATKKEIKPVVNKQLSSLFQKAFQGIKFESGNDIILASSKNILNQIAGVLKFNPKYLIEIRGFTDNVGKPETNKKLSEKRAQAVKKYFVRKGVEEARIKAVGYGIEFPIADNKTSKGRALNRRVEFIVTYEEITLK